MITIIYSIFIWINMIIRTLRDINIIDDWSILDFYIYPFIFCIVIDFIAYVIKHRKKSGKSE